MFGFILLAVSFLRVGISLEGAFYHGERNDFGG